jgi:hypothetical protein
MEARGERLPGAKLLYASITLPAVTMALRKRESGIQSPEAANRSQLRRLRPSSTPIAGFEYEDAGEASGESDSGSPANSSSAAPVRLALSQPELATESLAHPTAVWEPAISRRPGMASLLHREALAAPDRGSHRGSLRKEGAFVRSDGKPQSSTPERRRATMIAAHRSFATAADSRTGRAGKASRNPATEARVERQTGAMTLLVRASETGGRSERRFGERQGMRSFMLSEPAISDTAQHQAGIADIENMVNAPSFLSMSFAKRTANGDGAAEAKSPSESGDLHDLPASMELRRTLRESAPSDAATSNLEAASAPPEITAEQLQKAISSLPQLHPDQIAEQVYKSLMKRMKLEQRLRGF